MNAVLIFFISNSKLDCAFFKLLREILNLFENKIFYSIEFKMFWYIEKHVLAVSLPKWKCTTIQFY